VNNDRPVQRIAGTGTGGGILYMMGPIAYTVIASLPTASQATEYVRWLQDGHLQRVLESGAIWAGIVRVEQPASPLQVESRYVFPDRPAFEKYLLETAPGLRAEGLERFPPSSSVSFERRVGTVVWASQ
jgi:hypothetical protein